MKIATRLWLSAAVSLLALAGFCVVLVYQLGDSRVANVVRSRLDAVAIGGAALVAIVIVGATVAAYGEMSARLRKEARRRKKAERMLNLIRRLADRLPGCLDDDEFSAVVESFAPMLSGERAGTLYLLNDSRNLLRSACSWNGPKSSLPEFTPEECWGLRRGQEHISGEGHVEVSCPHIVRTDGITHWCMPLIARGETVGLLYLEGADFADAGRRSGGHHVIYMLRETVALGLVNLRLREKLRTQSVRDPLTDLYNRRFLDESLDLELARASRSRKPVAAIMLDVDHFKNFNDSFGHEAGDVVLKSIANVLAGSARKGDVAGRFGGEEFVLVLPGAGVEQAVARAESIREAISSLDLTHGGQKLGHVTASFGVATYPADGETSEALMEAVDKSLYAAKTAGRDRVVASA